MPPSSRSPHAVPDPRELNVGDLVRFTDLPSEWSAPGHRVPEESVELVRRLISRTSPCRVARLDEHGTPWIDVRLRAADGTLEHHAWALREHTVWRRVR